MSPLLLLALAACGPREVCFGDCVDLGYDPGEYEGEFSSRVNGREAYDCEGEVTLEVDEAGQISGYMSCYTWNDFSGPVTGYVSDRSVSGLWVASAEVFYEIHTWQVPIRGVNKDEAIHATFEKDTDWIDVERGVLDATLLPHEG